MNNKSTKLTIMVPTESLEILKAHATLQNQTVTEALRRALGLQDFIYRESAKGSKILVESKRGTLRQLIIG